MSMEVPPKDPQRAGRAGRTVDGAKKYWWAGAIAVPVVVALIQVVPSLFGGSSSGNTYITNSRVGGDLYFTTIAPLTDPAARAQFDQAVALARDGKYAEAKVLFEQIAAGAKSADVYNNLGVVNAALGDDAAAQRSVQQALEIEPDNAGAKANLDLLAKSVKQQASNNTILTAAPIQLGANVESSIAGTNGSDFFTFTAPTGARDLLQVRIDNKSTTLQPHLKLFDAERAQFKEQYQLTPGANGSLEFASAPGSKYFAQVTSLSSTEGTYSLSITPRKAFDRFEPNDDILKPSEIRVGQDVEANIMDPADRDVYQLTVAAGPVRVVVTNRSATLAPDITVFDDSRAQVDHKYSVTPGAHLSAEAMASRPGTWYVSVSAFSGSVGGDYTLKVTQ